MPRTDHSSSKRKTGDERFRIAGEVLPATLNAFWQWSSSDLLSNTMRGVVAEFIVAMDLGIEDGVRSDWGPWDLETRDGVKVEVKASGYVQNYPQKRLSKITFGIAPASAWDGQQGKVIAEKKRRADIYVFALHKHTDKVTADPMDVSQWEFYVVPTAALDRDYPRSKRITLAQVKSLAPDPVGFGRIGEVVRAGNSGMMEC